MNREVDAHEVGRRLRELRGCRTMTGVARELGISYSALTQYEYGRKMPSDRNKVLLANYYGKSVQELFYSFEYHNTL